jgi:hypothetical protein
MVAEQWNLLFILYSVFIVWFGTRVMTDFFEIVRIREAMLRDRIVRVPQLGHQLRHFANASSAHFKALCNLRDEEQPPTPVPTVLVPFSLAKGVPELLIFGTQNEPDKRRSSSSSSRLADRALQVHEFGPLHGPADLRSAAQCLIAGRPGQRRRRRQRRRQRRFRLRALPRGGRWREREQRPRFSCQEQEVDLEASGANRSTGAATI